VIASTAPLSWRQSENGRAKEVWRKKVWKGGRKARRVSDAPEEERHTEKWTKRQESHEPQAGYRNRLVRSAGEGREGSAQAHVEEVIWRKEIFGTQIDAPKVILKSR
jgi:hypothetical protein